MRFLLAACLLVVVAACGVGGHAAFDENCGTPRDGGLSGNDKWETLGPWHVSMSYATARSIASRVGPSEFQPPNSHPSPNDVPCDIASAVSQAGTDAFTHWHSTSGTVNSGWTGYAAGPQFSFTCSGKRRSDGGATETCVHVADQHAGRVVVRFTIEAFDPPLLVPWRKIGQISLGESRSRVEARYGPPSAGGYYRLHGTRVYITFGGGVVTSLLFSTPYYRTPTGFGVGSVMPKTHTWHGFAYDAWNKGSPCNCWVKVGLGPRSLPATTANFLKPWFFINTKHGRVTSFYFALKFVD